MTSAVQPCDFTSSPVSSNIFVFSQPTTWPPPLVIDTNGNGKRDAYVEPDQPVDPTKDKRFGGGFYAVSPTPDGSIWGSSLGSPARSSG